MNYAGHYINLDRSPDRRAAMEAQLARLDPPADYKRFPATDGNPIGFVSATLSAGEIGVLSSHARLLRMQEDSGFHLHIIEDDTVLARGIVRFVDGIIAEGMLDRHDILFTSTVLSEKLGFFAGFYEAIRGAWKTDIRRAPDGTAAAVRFGTVPYLAGMESYLVNRLSIGRVRAILERELAAGPRHPLDLLLRREAERGALRAACLFPFITSVLPGAFVSTRDPGSNKELSVFAMELLRHSFFVECDLDAALIQARRLFPGAVDEGGDPHDRLHARIATFVESPAFQVF